MFHAGGPVQDYWDLVDRVELQLSKWGCIVDRCSILSEPVYGLVIRQKSFLGISEFDNYIQRLKDKNWGLIYCTGDWPIKQGKRWKSGEHMKAVEDKSAKIKNLYETVMHYVAGQCNFPVVSVNTNFLAEQAKKGNMTHFHRLAWMADRRPQHVRN